MKRLFTITVITIAALSSCVISDRYDTPSEDTVPVNLQDTTPVEQPAAKDTLIL